MNFGIELTQYKTLSYIRVIRILTWVMLIILVLLLLIFKTSNCDRFQRDYNNTRLDIESFMEAYVRKCFPQKPAALNISGLTEVKMRHSSG